MLATSSLSFRRLSSLHAYHFSFINKHNRPKLVSLSGEDEIKFYGGSYYYRAIMKSNYVKYIPLYVTSILPKFPYAGVNRATNYQYYVRYLNKLYSKIHKESKPAPVIEE